MCDCVAVVNYSLCPYQSNTDEPVIYIYIYICVYIYVYIYICMDTTNALASQEPKI